MNIVKKTRGLFYGWWMIFFSILLYITVGGISVYGFTAFYNPIVGEMGWSQAETALAFSLRSLEMGVLMPIVGFFIDRIGAKRCIFTGMVIIGIAFIMMSRVSSLAAFYFAFLMMSMGNTMGMGFAQFTVVANWFKRLRSRAMAVLSTGFGICGIMTPLLVYLIHTFGWRKTLFGLAFVVWAIGLPIAMMIRHRPEPYGYLPDGDKAEDPEAQEVSKEATQGARYSRYGRIEDSAEEGLTLRECLKTRNFWLLFTFTAFSAAAQSSMNVLAMPHLINVGIPETMAALAVTGITTSSLIGRLGIGSLGDTFDKKKLVIIAIVMRATGIFVFANIRVPWMIIPFLAMYGPGFGAPIPLLHAVRADCFGTKAFGAIGGTMALGHTVLGLVAPLFAGLVFDAQGSYRLAFIIFSMIDILALPAIMLIRIPTREKMKTGELEKATGS